MTTAAIVQKLWKYCNVLRDDGMSYGDYVEQLTFLLFLKMADERTKKPYSQTSPVPGGYDWPSLLKKDGDVRSYDYTDLVARDMVADLESALEQLRLIADDLGEEEAAAGNGAIC